jgi:hypothetical protein
LTPDDGKWQGIYGLTVYVYQLLFVFVIARIYPEDGGTGHGFKIRELPRVEVHKYKKPRTIDRVKHQ